MIGLAVALVPLGWLVQEPATPTKPTEAKPIEVQVEFVGKPADAFAGARVVSIEEIPKLWTIKQHARDIVVDNTGQLEQWGCADSAWGRIVECVGDIDDVKGDDVLIGTVVTGVLDEEALALVSGATGSTVIPIDDPGNRPRIADNLVACATSLGRIEPDGPPVFAIGSAEGTGMFCSSVGRVRLWGTTPSPRALAKQAPEGSHGDDFGSCMARVEASDGTVDVLVGWPNPTYEGGRAFLYSCRSAAPLHEWTSPWLPESRFAEAVAAGADLDHDGNCDLFVAGPQYDEKARGAVLAISGATLRELAVITPLEIGGHFGRRVLGCRDIDGDRKDELVVSAPWGGSANRGRVLILSDLSGTPRIAWEGDHEQACFGICVRADHDLDGDGTRDYVVGAPGSAEPQVAVIGEVCVMSGRDGRALLRVRGEPVRSTPRKQWGTFSDPTYRGVPLNYDNPATDSFGWAVATGDFDGDGLADLAIGSPQRGPNDCVGKVYAISGATLRELMRPREAEKK